MLHSPIEVAPAAPPHSAPVPPRRWTRKAAYVALPLLAVAAFGLKSLGAPDKAHADTPPTPSVTVSEPLVRHIAEWDDYVGRFQASQAVEIRPRVSGALQAIHFKDGDIVRKGQLLFTIDPRPFQAALAEARAKQASAATALALARSELARANRLVADQAVSQEEVDSLRAAARSAEAALAAAKAQVQARALDVEFTQVRSPIAGRISDRKVDIGNLVAAEAAGGATLLTTVNALDPIYFAFEGSEALYLKQLRENQGQARQVQIRLQDEAGYKWSGRMDFTDNALDTGSGTMRARAVVSNPGYFLKPGMFGNMRLTAGAPHDALLIPDAAVQVDQTRKVVYVVDKDGVVAAKPVQIGPLVNGLRVIRGGLDRHDKVVIQGVQYAPPGTPVMARNGAIAEAGPAPTVEAQAPVASQATIATR
ncbi:RND family efflux transporter, MFP subunit [Sphingomonas sp. YR710]|uniref:efflux RND transporter periplasmic adaptor subunit n=1 Tax=Sphingomonas sp. YR710 TaxID=1882773 RepID=UPI00088F689D|nr:efflux RND transporter periplasmic adaptor subunit [Sphingomonas sp. YR710]SDD29992.1 RND family efflux transporter, MFP subunit [Sphingomonas sp. YR710]